MEANQSWEDGKLLLLAMSALIGDRLPYKAKVKNVFLYFCSKNMQLIKKSLFLAWSGLQITGLKKNWPNRSKRKSSSFYNQCYDNPYCTIGWMKWAETNPHRILWLSHCHQLSILLWVQVVLVLKSFFLSFSWRLFFLDYFAVFVLPLKIVSCHLASNASLSEFKDGIVFLKKQSDDDDDA